MNDSPAPAAARGETGPLAAWRRPVVGILLLATLLALPAMARAFDESRMRALVEAGDSEAAWDYAREHRAGHEGRPVFDFWYGVAALDAGHVSEGIFALERVLLRQPGLARARLELARGYFLAGEDRRARRHFEAVLAQEPPAPVRATVERYLDAMRRRADRYTTVVSGYAEVGGGYDSNVNSATDAAEFDLFGAIPVALADDSREQSDDFARAAAGIELRRPLTPDTTFFVAGDYDETANDDLEAFDTRLLEARAGTVFHGERTRTRLGLRGQRFDVGGEPYRELAGIDIDARWRATPRLVVNGGARIAEQTYEDQENRDGLLGMLSVGLARIWQAPMRPVTSLGLFVGREEPDEDTDAARAVGERDMAGITGGLRLRLAAQWNLQAGLQYRASEYGAQHLLFQETREEDYYQADLALDWQPTTHWRIGPRVRHSVNDANVELNEYDRTVVELRVRYDFH